MFSSKLMNCFLYSEGCEVLVFKVISLRTKLAEPVFFFVFKDIKLGAELLLVTIFDYLFLKCFISKIVSNFWHAESNSNQFRQKMV